MNARTSLGLRAIEAALLLGVLGDGLLRAGPWGLNVALWIGALVTIAMVFVARRRRNAFSAAEHWLLLSALLFAASFGWRDSQTLNFLAGLCVLLALALTVWRRAVGASWRRGITEYVAGAVLVGINTLLAGFPMLANEVRWKQIPRTGVMKHAKGVLIGVVLSLPLLIIFGSLFTSADPGFELIINSIFQANRENLFGDIFLVLTLAWISGGFLHGIVFARGPRKATDTGDVSIHANRNEPSAAECLDASEQAQPAPRTAIRLGILEIGTALTLLNVLFLVFVLLQLRYLFGGAEMVQASDALTYSHYYRRGFFELVTAALLALPILLGGHWLLQKDDAAHHRIFRLLAGLQVTLILVIMVSAVRRMLLYQNEYGLTELRVYTTGFMAWLALVFVWFCLTVLRDRREMFACGVLISGFVIVAALQVLNPDALIVRVNVAHAQAGKSFDAHYAVSLSDDAVPALMESLPLLKAEDRRFIVEAKLSGRTMIDKNADWRTWNWSRARARDAERGAMGFLREVIDSPRDQLTIASPIVGPPNVEIETLANQPVVDSRKAPATRRSPTEEALTPGSTGSKRRN